MAHIPVDAAYLERFAKLADDYARTVREWIPAVQLAKENDVPATLNGVQTLYGNLERELERLALMSGQVGVIEARAKRAVERGKAKFAAKTLRGKKKDS